MPSTTESVWAQLDRVTDPELDDSIVELGYVDEVDVDGDTVTVRFTLPTAWCSPAFAWMMATDARDNVESIPEVSTANVWLRDHMHEDEINTGVNERRTFEESFPDADGEVASVRATLDDKARLSRQYAAVEALLEAGVSDEQICGLTLGDVDVDVERLGYRDENDRAAVYLEDGAFAVTVPLRPLARYVKMADKLGLATDEDDVLFRTPEREVIDPGEFELVHRRGRLAQTNMTGQGGVCDALNESRRKKLDRDAPRKPSEIVDAD